MPAYSPEESRIKMVVYTSNGWGYADSRETFYNFKSENRQQTSRIINKMTGRLLMKHKKLQFKLAIFYDLRSGREISRVKGHQLQS